MVVGGHSDHSDRRDVVLRLRNLKHQVRPQGHPPPSRLRRVPGRGHRAGGRLGHRQVGAAAHHHRSDPAKNGIVEMLGLNTATLHGAALRELQARWGVLFQDGALFSSLTVADNIQVPLREHARLDERQRDSRGAQDRHGRPAAGRRDKYPSELSGGMRKRASLARALALDAALLFLDEPTAGLDPIGAAAFDDLVALSAEPRPDRSDGDPRSGLAERHLRPHRRAARQTGGGRSPRGTAKVRPSLGQGVFSRTARACCPHRRGLNGARWKTGPFRLHRRRRCRLRGGAGRLHRLEAEQRHPGRPGLLPHLFRRRRAGADADSPVFYRGIRVGRVTECASASRNHQADGTKRQLEKIVVTVALNYDQRSAKIPTPCSRSR